MHDGEIPAGQQFNAVHHLWREERAQLLLKSRLVVIAFDNQDIRKRARELGQQRIRSGDFLLNRDVLVLQEPANPVEVHRSPEIISVSVGPDSFAIISATASLS